MDPASLASGLTVKSHGHHYELGDVLGVGGEGTVHVVTNHLGLVAKTYHHPLTRERQQKISELVRGAQASLLAVAAWPTDALIDAQGRVCGFTMERVDGALGLHELFSPRSRVRSFPAADFRFLVHVAANVARLFATVHACGYVIGDVNQNNVLVRLDGTVVAIDVDSFQIGNGQRYLCDVATELFLPPELKGVDLAGTPRTRDHDAFGLAVLLFQILFMGRHPHAGRYLGRGEMPIERAMADSRFAYSADEHRTRMAPPPHTPPLAAVGPAADLFERAFAPPRAKRSRPTPDEWLTALEQLRTELQPCGSVTWHHYNRNLSSCPWCTIEQSTRVKLFGGAQKKPRKVVADLAALWKRVELAGVPRPMPIVPTPEDWVPQRRGRSPALVPHRSLGILMAVGAPATVIAGVAVVADPGLVVLGTGLLSLLAAAVPWDGELAERPSRTAILKAEVAFNEASAARERLRSDEAHLTLKRKLDRLKSDLDSLGTLTPLAGPGTMPTEAEQREQFLAQHGIEQAKLFNIGPARCAVLRSWGVETAADVDEAKLAAIPGFGRNLQDRLVNWRERIEGSFVYTPPTLVQQPRDRTEFDREIAARRIRLMTELRADIDTYVRLTADIARERDDIQRRLSENFEILMRGQRSPWWSRKRKSSRPG